MTARHADRAAALVLRWVRFYTRRLPDPVAERRIEEIRADLHDHIAHERACGIGDRRLALGLLSRLVRGAASDAAWRHRLRPGRNTMIKSIAIAVLVIALGVAAMIYAQKDDAPGLGLIGLLLIIGAFAYGVRSALRRRPGR